MGTHTPGEGGRGLGCQTRASSSHACYRNRSLLICFSVQASKQISYEERFSLLEEVQVEGVRVGKRTGPLTYSHSSILC